ncbi:hypothetical protein EWM64_g4559 [Hericium alpestre]|uniref:Uncharacterized protein n=1 Tax=Hericium alpestre TaxID=135208 RepID=A0A4Y9ZY16_9AGAM|nr:hypothetical protein EWM64_g4559 [Hericium alpestre]
MLRAQDLPVGPTPGWELEVEQTDEDDASEPKSVADSLVIANSLKQSRLNWLSSTFPKFSSKARGGKTSDATPPPHTIRTLGKCDLVIGPHVFTGTTLHEVHYLPAYVVAPRAPYGSSAYGQYGQYSYGNPPLPASSPIDKPKVPSPPSAFSPAFGDAAISQELIAQVNTAAVSNPILARHLQLAAAGAATPEQLKTLGVLIQSLAAGPSVVPPPQPSAPSAPANSFYTTPSKPATQPQSSQPSRPQSSTPSASATPGPHPNYSYQAYNYAPAQGYVAQPPTFPTRDFDVILEFPEKPHDRWLIPRGTVVLERVPETGTINEICLSSAMPFPKVDYPSSGKQPTQEAGSVPPKEGEETAAPQEVVTLRFTKAHPTIWDSLLRWVGGAEKIEENRKKLSEIKAPDRVFLQYQVADSDLLAQLKAYEIHQATVRRQTKTQTQSATQGPRASRRSTSTETKEIKPGEDEERRSSKEDRVPDLRTNGCPSYAGRPTSTYLCTASSFACAEREAFSLAAFDFGVASRCSWTFDTIPASPRGGNHVNLYP